MEKVGCKSGMNKRKILALALVALMPIANASDWQVVASQGSSFFYMDFDSVASVGAYKKAWVKGEYYKALETSNYPKKEYHSSKTLYYFDCGSKMLGSTQFIAYEKMGGLGDVVASSSIKFDSKGMEEIIPDTMGEKFLTIACDTPVMRAKIKKQNVADAAAADREIQEYLKKAKTEKNAGDAEPAT